MRVIYELNGSLKPIMTNPILIQDGAEVPPNHIELDPSKSYTMDGDFYKIPLVELKQNKRNEIMDAYKKDLTAGLVSSATGVPVTFGYSPQDQLNYSKRANTLALDPNLMNFKMGTDSHGVIDMTREQFLIFMADADNHEMTLYAKRKDLEAQIELADELTLNNISWT